MTHRAILDTAILIGWSPDGKCVYSAATPLGQYWNGEHVWDNADGIKRIHLEKLRGFLFDAHGVLTQEFERNFDVLSGRFKSGWTKHADGRFERT